MKKSQPIFLCFVLVTSLSFSQISFTEHVITNNYYRPYIVYATDLDKDGDIDVLATSNDNDTLYWYKNMGNQNFQKILLSTNAKSPRGISVNDIDGDQDLDILYASYGDGKIVCYLNNGNNAFFNNTLISGLNGPDDIFVIDMDFDGSLDIVVAEYSGNKIEFYKNQGNLNFSNSLVSTNVNGPNCVYAIDIDSDNDIDIISSSFNDDKIAWYENDSNFTFTQHVISTSADGAEVVKAVDIDGDSDIDIISASSEANGNITLHKNDGAQSFSDLNINSNNIMGYGFMSLDLNDINLNGQPDVISASMWLNGIDWYENSSGTSFTKNNISTNAQLAIGVFSIDMDGDGDIDVLSASMDDDKLAWYENNLIQSLTISGKVIDDQGLAINSGEVSLLHLKQWGGAENVKTSTLDSNGTYYLNGVMSNSYLLKADVTDVLPNTLPTYYPDAFFWDSSEVINLISDTTLMDITILSVPSPPTPLQGSGNIYGYLLEGNAYRGPSDPIDSIVIGMTRPDTSGGVYMLDTTDLNGKFEFMNLPPGNYALFPDISGIPLDTVGWSNISITGSDTEKITFLADSNVIMVDSSVVTNIKEYIPSLKLWPNPVYDRLYVSLSEAIKEVKLYDSKGAVVSYIVTQTDDKLILDLDGLGRGIYILELRYADKLRMAKFIKQ